MAMTGAERLLAEGEAKGLVKGRAQGRAEGRAKGRAEGRAEGRAKGRAEGRATTLIELLEEGFGPLSDDVRTRVDSATEAELRSWTGRVLSAQSLADVFKDS